ncbi:hypothetical protein B0H13DRAFT_2038729 [Mycena leptocephala]|nr:hypothetical protein B0H13DRAFT_2038729 [Mycena leptocephala]
MQRFSGTLSKCAAHERKGGTFHFGNVPGLTPTTLGKDTCRTPALFLLPTTTSRSNQPTHTSKARQIPTDGTNNSKHSATTNSSLTGVSACWLIDFHTYNSASLPVAWPFEIADLNCKHWHSDAPLNLEGTILFGDAGPDCERSTGCGTRNSPLSLSIISKAARTEIWDR